MDLSHPLSGGHPAHPGVAAQLAAQSHGKVFIDAELAAVARVCLDHELIAVTDEVYEHLVYDGPSTARSPRFPPCGSAP